MDMDMDKSQDKSVLVALTWMANNQSTKPTHLTEVIHGMTGLLFILWNVERRRLIIHLSFLVSLIVAMDNGVEAIVQCSTCPMKWLSVENNTFVGFTLGDQPESFARVPLSSFVFTLCVIEDYGGEKNRYYVLLPKRGWGGYFGKDMV